MWDNKGKEEASAPAWFETGLLSPSDWSAKWIRRDDPAAAHELSAVRWLWLANADAQHVTPGTVAEFHYVLHLDENPRRASLHVVSRGAFVASVNGKETGNHTEWSAFDWEEITPELRFGAGVAGDNEVLVRRCIPAGHETEPNRAGCICRVHSCHRCRTAPSGASSAIMHGARERETAALGALPRRSAHWMLLSVWVRSQKAIAGPDRIVTDASLFRKEFSRSTVLCVQPGLM